MGEIVGEREKMRNREKIAKEKENKRSDAKDERGWKAKVVRGNKIPINIIKSLSSTHLFMDWHIKKKGCE